jgi:hypothetical protein
MADKFEQIRKLLDLADDSRTPPHEADTARKAAERLMLRHAIDEEEVRQAAKERGATFEVPIIKRVNVYDSGNAFGWMLAGMFRELARHSRCRLASRGWENGSLYQYVVGFKSDIQFLEMLYTVVRLAFSANVEPPYDPTDYDGSVARMHLAGITWRDIAYRTETPWPDGQKLRRAWYRYADAHSLSKQDGHRRSPRLYRESFAEGFYNTIIERLWRLRYDAEREQMAETGERGALALRTREEVVEEFLYERFPNDGRGVEGNGESHS